MAKGVEVVVSDVFQFDLHFLIGFKLQTWE